MPYKDAAAQREYQRKWMAARRAEYLDGRRCSFCNSEGPLEIHHFDPAIKVTHAIWSWTRERREAELAKCIVICSACHRKHHAEERRAICRRGHPLTRENVYVSPNKGGKRECRTCRALRRQRLAA